MPRKESRQTAGAELRRRAEERLGESGKEAHPPGTDEEPLRLLHELKVHRVELEMQNAELRQARDDAETALEKYSDLYDFAPVGYFTLDRNGIIHGVNLTGAGLVGVERSRLIGRRFAQFLPAGSSAVYSAFLRKLFASQGKESCDVVLLNEGNPLLFVQIEGVAAASGGECRIAVIDVTERRRAEELLRQAKEAAEVLRREKEAAEATAQLKSQFLANMSHELRTPMTGILGMLELALGEELAPTLREYLETALGSARSLLRILNDVLHMAKIEAGKVAIEEKPFSLRGCVVEAVDMITPEVRRKGLDFETSVAGEVPELVAGDQMRLRQVLINLIGNAVKFTNGGKVTVQVSAGGTTAADMREFTFAVTDTGIGIPDDKKELLFHAFSQVDPSFSRRQGGTGLGLAICREIVKLMGGTISFTSVEGVGSTFSFTIPLAEAGPECAPLPPVGPRSTETTASPPGAERMPRLLLVEDDPAIRTAFGLLLKRANFELDFAADGLQAFEMWETGGYDLVLMDVQMPGVDGFEVTRAIRERERERGGHTPIIAVTAHSLKEDEERCLEAGMDAYISKPVDFKKSVKFIGEIIKRNSGG